MARFLLAIAALVATMIGLGSSTCRKVVLQSDINYAKIAGNWHQFRHTADSFYTDLNCYYIKISDVNVAKKSFQMKAYFNPQKTVKKGLSPVHFTVFPTNAQWGSRSEDKPYIGDHLITDYTNYLIMYQCLDDTPLIDIQLREGVTQLPAGAVENIKEHLIKIGGSYDALEQVDESACPSPFDLAQPL